MINKNMKKYLLGKYLILFLVLCCIPSIASASSIYFETSKDTVFVGDTFIISVKIDSEKTKINSVEGDIVLNQTNNVAVNDFSLAKSVFSLWPRTPSLSTDGNTISFVGGVPGGFDLDKAIVFNIIVEANKEGEVKISPKNIAVFANDGSGTKVPVTFKNLTLKILPKNNSVASSNEWLGVVSSDKINPEKFDIVVGKDASLFEGKRFAFFTAVDNQSGVSYYEVSENGTKAVRSGSMYVLLNQDENTPPRLEVTAYDKAGNKTVSVYKKPAVTIFGFSINFIVTLFVIVILFILIRKILKIRKIKKNV
jgi:hypothetical protein